MPEFVPPSGPVAPTASDIAAWETQEPQYPDIGPPGLSYFAGETALGTIDCLLWRSEAGELVGILNHYPFRTPEGQEPGTLNVWVKPGWQRRGIGRRLAREATERWDVDANRQSYTDAGATALVRWYAVRQAREAAERGEAG